MDTVSTWSDDVGMLPGKVGALRTLSLTPTERSRLLARFLGYPARDRTPTNPLLPAETQEKLQQQHPVDLDLVRELAVLVGKTSIAQHIRVPASEADHRAFTGCEEELADAVINLEMRGESRSPQVTESLRKIYQYMIGVSGPDPFESYREGDTEVDLVIVPGCRGDGIRHRADRAIQVARTSPTDVRLYLSGLHPYYARQFDLESGDAKDDPAPLPFGEADAMAATIESIDPSQLSALYGPSENTERPLRRVIIDSRARNTFETIVHCLPVLQEMYMVLQRPVNICLVTAPYHMRRVHLLTTVRLETLLPVAHLVGSVVTCVAATDVGVRELTTPTADLHRKAVVRYLREHLKLLGGRVTGEF